ncbi:thioredoxin-like domain-containing protein [Ditylenchus destructor]|nr:thioredoxin-like domain-containing protein [Ditylenchus destructor]
MSEQDIKSFREITGCKDNVEAAKCLKTANNNLEKAINQYFSRVSRKRANLEDDEPGPSSSRQIPQRKSARQAAMNGVGNERSSSPIHVVSDDDEALEEVTNGVRAPIAPVRGALVEQSFRQTYGSRRAGGNPIFEQYRDFRQAAEDQNEELSKRLYAARNGGRIVDNAGGPRIQPNRDAQNGQAKSNSLSNLFRPPLEIMHTGDWNSALREAKQKSIWLLVNIQNAEEFACQVLNRDVWSDPIVQDVVGSNFLLWQVYHDSPDGARVLTYYPQQTFPAIFLVDPRTGEEVLKLKATDAVSFLDQITAFSELYPTFAARDASLVGDATLKFDVGEGSNTSSQNTASSGAHKRKMEAYLSDDDSDSEATMTYETKRMKRIMTIDDDDDDIIAIPTSSQGSTSKEKAAEPKIQVDPDEWKRYIPEPIDDTRIVKLLIRTPEGQKHHISIPNATKLKALFVFITGLAYDPSQYVLVLNFPKRVFSSKDDSKTLDEAEFADEEVIHIEKI